MAEVVAETVWKAVHDPSDRLRYPSGKAAIAAMKSRDALDDDVLRAATRERFGL
ncbi:MAG: hypothetical protein AAF850_12295 [Pseudomonadota bacterium]